MNINNCLVSKLIIIIVFICSIYILFFDYDQWLIHESFQDNENLQFKKTLTYDLIYHNKFKNYSIWCPRIIDDYFPLGHIITKGNRPPNKLSLLIKSQGTLSPKDKPSSYLPVSFIIENQKPEGAFWKPVENKGYKALGHIFHKPLRRGSEPSIHKHIRCINNKYLLPNSVEDIVISEKKTPGYQVWNIQESNLFLSNDKVNSKEPKDKVFKINPKFLTLSKKIKTKKTNSYKLIYTTFNRFTKKYISFWRPLSNGDYVSLGDIVIDKDPRKYNPNKNLETIMVHKSITKLPVDFGTDPMSVIKNNVNIEASFWKPRPPDGYGCLGYVVNIGEKEPKNNNIINCIPLEYLVEANSKKKALWNTIQIPKNRMSIWSSNNNFFITNNRYGYHNDLDLELDETYIDYEQDILDKKTIISLNFKLNPKNSEMYNSDTRDKLFRETLSSRLGIKNYRLGYLKFFGRKVSLELIPRPAGSQEPMITDIINNLKLLIKNNLTIINSKKDGFISTITNLVIESEADDKITSIDNTSFNKKIKQMF